jgi:hypothetical protein
MGRYKSRAWSYEKYKYNRYVHSRKSIHAHKDSKLRDEVDNYLFRHDTSLTTLVTMLLSNDFVFRRYSDR